MDFGKVQCREGSSNRWIQFDFVQDRCFFSGKMAAVEESVGDSNVRWPMCIMRNDQYTVDWATNKCTGHWAMCNGQLKGGGWTNKAFKGCDGANLSLAKFVGYLWKGSRARGKFELGLQAQKLGVHEKEMSPLVFLQHGGRFNLRICVFWNHL